MREGEERKADRQREADRLTEKETERQTKLTVCKCVRACAAVSVCDIRILLYVSVAIVPKSVHNVSRQTCSCCLVLGSV